MHIAREHGVDSAIALCGKHHLHVIDSLTALELMELLNGDDFKGSAKSYFYNMAINWKAEPIKAKTKEIAISELDRIKAEFPNSWRQRPELDDALIISLITQKPDSLDSKLMEFYDFFAKQADKYRYSNESRMKSLTRTKTRISEYSHFNCYKIMWTLKRLGSPLFDEGAMSYHYCNSLTYAEDWDATSYTLKEYSYSESPGFVNESGDIIAFQLSKHYESLGDIDFDNEPVITRLINEERYAADGDISSWNILLAGDRSGFWDIGHNCGFLCGSGIIFRIELVDGDKLKLYNISAWVS